MYRSVESLLPMRAMAFPMLGRLVAPGRARPSVCRFGRSLRAFSGDSKEIKEMKIPQYLNSWVEPEALWEFNDTMERTNAAKQADAEIGELGDRNKAWQKETLKQDPEFFKRIGQGQAPKYLWIGCADSRVAAENLIGGNPGELFTHRNIANMVVATDTNLRSVLQYAVDVLQVRHIIVCGHYDCGGVKAACSVKDHALPLESWLSGIRDVYRLHREELDAIDCPDERHKRMVELNVIEQCLNLFKTSDIQRRRRYTASRIEEFGCALPRVHAMVFSPADGILRRLNVDYKKHLGDSIDVYHLYDDPLLDAAELDEVI
ncbi:unnamed protein product [Cladocopium goreaui]|uniref:Carbonic anhydrase n=1 Tax=Cladocopium goreaui TaxID=2562237 RepID=A0A9P1CMV9_9DINO|nr:unnamed protein product [Cladocopium goreaui]